MSKTSLAEVVRGALDELPPEQQKAFALMVLHGVPMRQVAARGGGSFEDLQDRVTAAMKHIKARLDAAGYGVRQLS